MDQRVLHCLLAAFPTLICTPFQQHQHHVHVMQGAAAETIIEWHCERHAGAYGNAGMGGTDVQGLHASFPT